jgi:hypothetical protein
VNSNCRYRFVNVEIADLTYRPADAAFENLQEARYDLLFVTVENSC